MINLKPIRTMNESGQGLYLQRLTALIQLYLELELSLLDAILAAESDLVPEKNGLQLALELTTSLGGIFT